MKTSWEINEGRTCHYIYVRPTEVVVGTHHGSGHTDNAASCSHPEFLKGKFQDHIQGYFGQGTLEEVISSVQHAANYPPFSKVNQATARRRAWFEALPKNPRLKEWADSPDKTDGFRAYGNAGGYRTKVVSDTCNLDITQGKGKITFHKSGLSFPVKLQAGSSDVIEKEDHFYINQSDTLTVIGPSGKVVFDSFSTDFDNCQFGTQVRINRIYRLDGHIFASYHWMSNEHPPGWLEVQLPEGFVSWWEREK